MKEKQKKEAGFNRCFLPVGLWCFGIWYLKTKLCEYAAVLWRKKKSDKAVETILKGHKLRRTIKSN